MRYLGSDIYDLRVWSRRKGVMIRIRVFGGSRPRRVFNTKPRVCGFQESVHIPCMRMGRIY